MMISAAVLPGAGHFLVGAPKRGAAWCLAFLAAGTLLMWQAGAVLTPLMDGLMSPNGEGLSPEGMSFGPLIGLGFLCFVIWAGALADLWRSSRPSPVPPDPGLTPFEGN